MTRPQGRPLALSGWYMLYLRKRVAGVMTVAVAHVFKRMSDVMLKN